MENSTRLKTTISLFLFVMLYIFLTNLATMVTLIYVPNKVDALSMIICILGVTTIMFTCAFTMITTYTSMKNYCQIFNFVQKIYTYEFKVYNLTNKVSTKKLEYSHTLKRSMDIDFSKSQFKKSDMLYIIENSYGTSTFWVRRSDSENSLYKAGKLLNTKFFNTLPITEELFDIRIKKTYKDMISTQKLDFNSVIIMSILQSMMMLLVISTICGPLLMTVAWLVVFSATLFLYYNVFWGIPKPTNNYTYTFVPFPVYINNSLQ